VRAPLQGVRRGEGVLVDVEGLSHMLLSEWMSGRAGERGLWSGVSSKEAARRSQA
jgi:hypothetical protein